MYNVKFLRSAVALLYHGGGHRAAASHGPHHVSDRPHRQKGRKGPRFPGLWHFAAEYLLLLPLGAVIALVWANTLPESYFGITFRMEFIVNDVAMVLFFGLIMKEVAEATAPGGVLHPKRRALLPLVASVGLTAVPALVFISVGPYFGEPRLVEGWPVVFASDVAFGYLIARVIFGKLPAGLSLGKPCLHVLPRRADAIARSQPVDVLWPRPHYLPA